MGCTSSKQEEDPVRPRFPSLAFSSSLIVFVLDLRACDLDGIAGRPCVDVIKCAMLWGTEFKARGWRKSHFSYTPSSHLPFSTPFSYLSFVTPPPLRVPKIITSTYVFDHILTHFASREKLNESTHPSFKLKDNHLAPEAAPEGGGGGANGDANGSAGAMGGGGS